MHEEVPLRSAKGEYFAMKFPLRTVSFGCMLDRWEEISPTKQLYMRAKAQIRIKIKESEKEKQ
jgi:hypothetical protein